MARSRKSFALPINSSSPAVSASRLLLSLSTLVPPPISSLFCLIGRIVKDHRLPIKRRVIAASRLLLPREYRVTAKRDPLSPLAYTARQKGERRGEGEERERGRFRVLETSSIWRHRTSGLPMSGFLSHRRDLKAPGDTLGKIKLSSGERASERPTRRSDFILE